MAMVEKRRSGTELRKKPRRQFHYGAKILTDKENPPVACLISNISDSGARLELENDVELPDTFWLLLTPKGDARRHCRVVWREKAAVGVKFPDSR